MAQAAELIGDRWTLLILREAFYGVTRFEDMHEDLEAPRSALTERLRRLVDARLLERVPYREPGSRTRWAYVLTEKGLDLAFTFLALTAWGEKHITGEAAPVEVRDVETDEPLSLRLLNADRNIVPIQRARLRRRSEV
ncbi:MAG: helix-turn-helix domain-containing protein [Pseudomonadota bacterium]